MSYHDDLMARISAAKSCKDLEGCTDATASYSDLLSSLNTQIANLTPLAIPPTTPAGVLIWAAKLCQQYTNQISAATSQISSVSTQQSAAAAAIAAKAAELEC
jgi:hypothetical protein